jgi:hypothetical protein
VLPISRFRRSKGILEWGDDDNTQYSSPTPLSAASLAMPAMTPLTTHALIGDGLMCQCGSSTAVAAALVMSTWKQDPPELAEGLSIRAACCRKTEEERSIKFPGDFLLAISSPKSPSSSSNDDDADECYEPVNSSPPSRPQAAVNLRTQLSRTRTTYENKLAEWAKGDTYRQWHKIWPGI